MAERIQFKASHGRGGAGQSPSPMLLSTSSPPISLFLMHKAGNIGPTVNDASQSGLTTPTIKTSIYTTGRGGSGNMKQNDPRHPEIARRAQDVAPPVKRKYSDERGHIGRGERSILPLHNTYESGDGRRRRRKTTSALRQNTTGGAANIIHPSIDEVTHTADEKALIEEGMMYERERKQAGGTMGDWWRDEMATGGAVRRR
ncbi:MAG: hypothetical protein Q9168_001820 [Polycauliona sp. 1 TL-2023]